jgi:hypothetical protein
VAITRLVDVLRHGLAGAPPASFEPASILVDRTAQLREEYAQKRRVIIPGLLEESLAHAVAANLATRRWKLAFNSRVRRLAPEQGFQWQAFRATVHPSARCRGPCWALCGFGDSLLRGRLRDWIREITAMPHLLNQLGPLRSPMMVAHAYAKGSYLEAHEDSAVDRGHRRAVAFVWHGSEAWQASFGGVLRFVASEPPDTWVPRFNDLHVFEVGPHNRHEVTLVTADAVRYSLSGWWYEKPTREDARFTSRARQV